MSAIRFETRRDFKNAGRAMAIEAGDALIGRIATSPQKAIFGEGRGPEVYREAGPL